MFRNRWLRSIAGLAHSSIVTTGRRKPDRRRLAVEALESRSLLAVFTVTSTGDMVDAGDGVLTLREAIAAANSHPNSGGPDQIHFNIPTTDPGYNASTGTFTIRPVDAGFGLWLLDPVILDAWTQPGWSGKPIIELDGSQAGTVYGGSESGLHIATSHSTVRGLVINRFAMQGLVISGGFFGPHEGYNTIQGCYIGTDVTGTQALGNGSDGIVIYQGSGDRHLVGTDGDGLNDAAERNVISGNSETGVLVFGGVENIIAGNFIGTNATGTAGLGNRRGIALNSGHQTSRNRIGTNADGIADDAERNVISGNLFREMEMGFGHDVAGNNVVAGNFIGTDVTGTVALGAAQFGIGTQGHDNRIGTNGDGIHDAAERNVIAGNYQLGSVYVAMRGNVVAGNYIGTDRSGTIALGNPGGGVGVLIAGTHNRIGTNGDGVADEAERNVISGNGTGINIRAARNQVSGNSIGLSASGAPLGNTGDGILLEFFAHDTQIGGGGAMGNTIAHNGRSGIALIHYGDVYNNSLRGNSIYANGGLGIDLTDGSWQLGVSPNDSGDADGGANHLQNFPVLDSVQGGATTRVTGTLNSLAGTTFTLDFYANATLDPSGHGEGERWLGSASVTTDAAGNASFEVTLTAATTSGESITSTATDPHGNTSEFSTGAVVTNLPPLASAGGPYQVVRGSRVQLDGSASTDPDQAADSLTYEWDLDGDGEYDDAVGMRPFFSAAGMELPATRTIGLRVTDSGGLENRATAKLEIVIVALRDDPLAPGGTMLEVGGTLGDDIIVVSPVGPSGDVKVTLNHESLGVFSPTSRLAVYGQDGDDHVLVAGSITLSAWLYGDGGHDWLKGGAGNDVLDGGAGNDVLLGGAGRDLLEGGRGADMILGNAGEDILIAGWLDFADRELAVSKVMAEWTSTRDQPTRFANLSGVGTGERANEDYFLKRDETVRDDEESSQDVLIGSVHDWFFFWSEDRARRTRDDFFTHDG